MFSSSRIDSNIEVINASKIWAQLHFRLGVSFAEDGVESTTEQIATVTLLTETILDKMQNDENFVVELEFLDRNQVSEIVMFLTKALIKKDDVFPHFYVILKRLLRIQPRDTFTQSVLQQIVALSSVHWMSGELKLGDLRLGDNIANNLMRVSVKMKGTPCAKTIELLSVIPREVAPKWRLNVLKKAWHQGSKDLKVAMVKSLPLFLHNLGQGFHVLTKEIVDSSLKENLADVLLELAKMSGPIICAMAKRGTQIISQNSKDSVLCGYCDQDKLLQSPSEKKPPVIPLSDVQSLLKLVGHNDGKVSFAALSMVKPISNHVGFNLSMATLFLNSYLNGTDEFLRFSPMVSHLVVPPWFANGKGSIESSEVLRLHGWDEHVKVCGALVQALKECPKEVVEPLCLTVTKIAQLNLSVLEDPILELMLGLLFQSHSHVSIFCYAETILKQKIGNSKSLATSIIAQKMCDRTMCPREVLDLLMALYKSGANLKTFLSQQVHHLVPQLVLHSSRNKLVGKDSPIDFVASQLQRKSKHLLAENFQYIFPHIVTQSKNTEEYNECVKFLEVETKVDIKQLLPSNRQKIITELLIYFHTHQKRVLTAFRLLAKNDDDFLKSQAGVGNGDTKSQAVNLPQYILPRFLGILGYFDYRLSNNFVAMDCKLRMLRSLNDILRFMGATSISTVKHKIVSTLNTAWNLKHRDVPFLVCDIWETFVKTIEVAAIGPMLEQIAANLLKMLPLCPEKILSIFKFLIIENKSQLCSYFDRLHFLPEYDELADISDAVRAKNGVTPNTEFRKVLAGVMRSMDNENVEVKAQTLKKLHHLLKFNQGKLQGLIMSSDQVDSVVTQIILTLLKSTRESDKTVTALAAKCLGKIGAVDPGRLQIDCDFSSDSEVLLDVLDEKFAHDLIKILLKSFLGTTESSETDACSFSLQEVLKAYGIRGPDKMTTSSGRIWNRFSDSDKEILYPLLKSLYTRSDSLVRQQLPVIRHSSSYKEWLANWSFHLISKLPDNQAKKTFTACKPTIKTDANCAQFLLPYILVYVLKKPSTLNEVLAEVEAVFDYEEEEEVSKIMFENLKRLSCHTMFSVLDHLSKWLRTKYAIITANVRKTEDPTQVASRDPEYVAIKTFVEKISQKKLCKSSHACNAQARSLMHLESHLRENPDDLPNCIGILQQIYGELNEPDYVAGLVQTRKTEPTVEELMHQHQIMGNFQDALACCETIGRKDKDPTFSARILQCYLEMDQPHTASTLAKGLVDCHPDWSPDLIEYQLEAAWQLGQWEVIREAKVDHVEKWNVTLSKLLYFVKEKNSKEVEILLDEARQQQISTVSAAAMEQGSYQRCYGNIVKLQILDEIETLYSLNKFSLIQELFEEWSMRITFSQYSLANLEPVLKVRRSLLSIYLDQLKEKGDVNKEMDLLQNELKECWQLSSKVARKAGQCQKAYSILLEAKGLHHPSLFIERSKIHWARGFKTEAISELKSGLIRQYPAYGPDVWHSKSQGKLQLPAISNEDKVICSKAKSLLAKYVDEASNFDADMVQSLYNEARILAPQQEDIYYSIGKFFDKIIGKNYKEADLDTRGEIVFHIISQYARSLCYGCSNLHQSLPRMLSLWFDYGSRVVDVTSNKKVGKKIADEMVKSLKKMCDLMLRFHEKTQKFYFLAAFPQLTSRICHSHPEVWKILRQILINGFLEYPHHCFWQLVSLLKSSYQTRAARSKEILEAVKSRNGQLSGFINDGLKLADQLIKLSDEKSSAGTASLKKLMPTLYRLVTSQNFSQIMLPNTRNMTLRLPTKEVGLASHNPFRELTYIQGVEDEVTIMRSLVRPKKIDFRGSDGKRHAFLCKPKDDLRRDTRFIDFNNLLNKLFVKDPESRKRNLLIRTYTVIPLNELNGIIEWIDNLQPLRKIIQKLLREKLGNKVMTSSELTEMVNTDDPARNRRNYDTLIRRHPPVFVEWFVRNFPDPQAWYMARLAYTRTTAVMSMIGYLIGLGDRHGENILFDSKNGDTVHVDLNCLFNKGAELKVPEVVPFRLTHNMVQAMGPSGYEGPFKIACEVALGLMRKQKDILVASLRPFIFDPLVDWVKEDKKRKTDTGEVVNETAVETLKNIENRLNGLIESKKSSRSTINMPLSVAGQVRHLINEATSHENLSQMYIGWGSYN